MGISFIIKRNTVVESWHTYRDQTYWEAGTFGSWEDPLTFASPFDNGWQDDNVSLDRYVFLNSIYVPWQSGFEPEKVRVTLGHNTELNTPILVALNDTGNPLDTPIANGYASSLDSETQQITLDLDWDTSLQSRPSYPHMLIASRDDGQPFNINNIEFYH